VDRPFNSGRLSSSLEIANAWLIVLSEVAKRLRILKKLPRPSGRDRARKESRSGRNRDLVRRRGAHRSFNWNMEWLERQKLTQKPKREYAWSEPGRSKSQRQSVPLNSLGAAMLQRVARDGRPRHHRAAPPRPGRDGADEPRACDSPWRAAPGSRFAAHGSLPLMTWSAGT
jgi:hypothetical protein